MNDDANPKWFYPHLGSLPRNNRAVAVLLIFKDGTFGPDIGRYCGEEGWCTHQCATNKSVVAWANMPDFEDDTEIKDNDL